MSKATKVLTLVIVQAFNAAIGVLFLPYLVRALNVQDYGTYGQALLVSDIARSFFTLGLPSVLYVHLSREKDSPQPRPIQPPALGRVVAVPQVGGLHHRYERAA